MGRRIAQVELLLLLVISAAVYVWSGDMIQPGEFLRDNETLVSAGDTFVLGYFSPDKKSSLRYLGIWFKIDPKTVVWVANRNQALSSSNGFLILTEGGSLLLLESNTGVKLWSTSTAILSPVVQLQDNGNLVLNDTTSNSIKWQSFDNPSDTLLAGMQLGVNLRTGASTNLTSWKSFTDPSPGDYTYKMNATGIPQLFLWKRNEILYRSGPWNGRAWSGRPEMALDRRDYFIYNFVSHQDGIYYAFGYKNNSILSRIVLAADGKISRRTLEKSNPIWQAFWTPTPLEFCDYYDKCGAFSVCSGNRSAPCKCIHDDFVQNKGTKGCTRLKLLGCLGGDTFSEVSPIKLPDTSKATSNDNIDDCQSWCLNNCSCMAYAFTYNRTRCLKWTGDLIDMRLFTDTGGADTLYIKVASSAPVSPSKNVLVKVVPAAVVGSLFLIFLVSFLLWRNRSENQGPGDVGTGKFQQQPPSTVNSGPEGIQGSSAEQPLIGQERNVQPSRAHNAVNPVTGSDRMLGVLPIYDLSSIKVATNNFSADNFIGEGGYGIVYKGLFPDGEVIAVKKLLRLPLQGPDMFKNEVMLIANLQHINLIRLCGCCIDGDEKILILEYMENGSLDTYIYDKTKSGLLDWRMRLDIIMGVAQGLLYLHRDSNLRVIHRDLKPSNILLDHDMNPRITDFGISRIYDGDEFREKATSRPVGTLAYMAPEYLTTGRFSFKSDVFSFGVILLEILSGRKNTNTRSNLLASAYNLWKEGRSLEILDQTLDSSYPLEEVMRCIRVGLMCVEEKIENRPTMAQVIRMLSSEVMPTPKMGPAVGTDKNSRVELSSSNEVSITLEPR